MGNQKNAVKAIIATLTRVTDRGVYMSSENTSGNKKNYPSFTDLAKVKLLSYTLRLAAIVQNVNNRSKFIDVTNSKKLL